MSFLLLFAFIRKSWLFQPWLYNVCSIAAFLLFLSSAFDLYRHMRAGRFAKHSAKRKKQEITLITIFLYYAIIMLVIKPLMVAEGLGVFLGAALVALPPAIDSAWERYSKFIQRQKN